MEYDLIIIGGGPAGVAAGVYASRKRLKTLFLTDSFGGQSIDSEGIENWIGTVKIPGLELAKALKAHLEAYAADIVSIHEGERADKVTRHADGKRFVITTAKGEYAAKTVLVATGSHRRKITVPGADTYENKGITYCASCDGPLYADADVVVIGGGNAAFESAAQLLAYAKSVTLINRSDVFRADPATVEKVRSHPKMKIVTGADLAKVKGGKFVSLVVYTDKKSGKNVELPVTGVFVEIGLLPTTYFVEGLVALNEYKQIVVDPRTQRASVAGIWAAGDCTDGFYHQNNIAAGDAVKALEDLYLYLHAAM